MKQEKKKKIDATGLLFNYARKLTPKQWNRY